jgi:hypothetical protein
MDMDEQHRTQMIGMAKVATTKNASDIVVNETKLLPHNPESANTTRQVTLAEKIDEYNVTLGYSQVHVVSLLLQLLIDGKIRVVFADYSERLELIKKEDTMTRAEASHMFQKHFKNRNLQPKSN